MRLCVTFVKVLSQYINFHRDLSFLDHTTWRKTVEADSLPMGLWWCQPSRAGQGFSSGTSVLQLRGPRRPTDRGPGLVERKDRKFPVSPGYWNHVPASPCLNYYIATAELIENFQWDVCVKLGKHTHTHMLKVGLSHWTSVFPLFQHVPQPGFLAKRFLNVITPLLHMTDLQEVWHPAL